MDVYKKKKINLRNINDKICTNANIYPNLNERCKSILEWEKIYLKTGTDLSTVKLNITWNDQGWGNDKGELYVKIEDGDWTKFGKRAPDKPTTVNFSLQLKGILSNLTVIKLGYRVGGDGGHILKISNANLTYKVDTCFLSTQPPTQPPTRPPTQPPTRPPTQPPTGPPIQPVTQPVTETTNSTGN